MGCDTTFLTFFGLYCGSVADQRDIFSIYERQKTLKLLENGLETSLE